jgi:hypothetical protein
VSDVDGLRRRLERLEAIDEIRQLPPKYALAVDMRDLDALVNLFVDDVGAPGGQKGRQALKRWYNSALRTENLGTGHCPGGHIIDFDADSDDLATGLVYSRNDIEGEATWLIELMTYLDRYERRDGRWYFQRRTPLFWYQCDITNPPVGEQKLRFPGHEWTDGAFHEPFPSWNEFWADPDYGDRPVATAARFNGFLEGMRRGRTTPRVNPAGGSATAPKSG